MTPRHRAFIDAMLQSNMHIIATGRSKTETTQQEGTNGKKGVVKLGMKTEQRDGFEYEFTVVLDIIHDGHFAVASKDRTGLFSGDAKAITEATGAKLLAWLEAGVDVAPVDYMKSINEAQDIATLKSHFAAAWKMGDTAEKPALNAAYDKRTSELTPQEGEE